MKAAIIVISLMGLVAFAHAAGPDMTKGSEKECDIAFQCYDKCGHGDKGGNGLENRMCFFGCVGKRDEYKVSDGFVKEVEEVYKWCKHAQRGEDAPEAKVLKCALKKVKKDACRWYFRMQKN